MEHEPFEIPRRVPTLDLIIVVAVVLMVGIDLVLIRDPLHTLLGLLMLPASFRVLAGFHFVRIASSDGRHVLVAGRLGSVLRFDLTDVSVTLQPSSNLWGQQRIAVFLDGERAVVVGQSATAEELSGLTAALEACARRPR